jgi:exoribonuclease-2
MGRIKLVQTLKEMAQRRNALIDQVNIRELWEVLNTEQEWINLPTMTSFCFSDPPTNDQKSAVMRAFFQNRTYFKFNQDSFFPYSEEQVRRVQEKTEEEERKETLIRTGSQWLKSVIDDKRARIPGPVPDDRMASVEILKDYYLFEKDSETHLLAKAMLAKAGIKSGEMIFNALVKVGIWHRNENLDLLRYRVPEAFPEPVKDSALSLTRRFQDRDINSFLEEKRIDLTHLPLMTIDGQATLDFDDALSIEDRGDHYLLGVHIADVAHFVEKDGPVDREALLRGSSIYMPDKKISMVPPELAEDLCSLIAGKLRPALSVLMEIEPSGKVRDYSIVPSVIMVKRKLTYSDANTMTEEDGDMALLHRLAQQIRQFRLAQGAVQISLPEVSIWLDETGQPNVSKVNRESPGRMLVAELMILANWLMAKHLHAKGVPAVFRSQPEPRERLFKQAEGSLFQNWMQRKCLSRFVLDCSPAPHSGLGLDAYITATSPIRKYFDLINQRQIRASLGLDTPYSADEIGALLQKLTCPMSYVGRLQFRRNQFWLLKHLEKLVGQKEEAIVLSRRKNGYQILLTAYMLECFMPQSSGIDLKPEDVIRITIQNINPRNDVISVFLG